MEMACLINPIPQCPAAAPAPAYAGDGGGLQHPLRLILPHDRLLQSAVSIMAWSCCILIYVTVPKPNHSPKLERASGG